MNPKIKVDADLDMSAASAEISEFRKELAELKKEMNSEAGKNRLETEMYAAGDALNKLMQRYDQLLKKLDSVDKSGKKYANTLKEIGNLTREAAKVSSKIEDLGSLKNANRSGYFLDESSAHGAERARVLDQIRSDTERSRNEARQDANQSKWFDRAVKFAGFAGGAALGGGNVGSSLGAGAGSMLGGGIGKLLSFIPGAGKVLSVFGSAAGGAVGGMADNAYNPSKEEAVLYSDLRHAIGATRVDFEALRGSVRQATEGMGITYNEAGKLADQFVRVSNASDNGDIGDSVNTSIGFARNYGMQPGSASGFFASMRLFGSTKNDQDNRKLASLIGESVTRTGTTAKTEEVLSALQGFASNASRTLLAQNTAGYLSQLASLMGSNSIGMKGNPDAAASVLGKMNNAIMSGGGMGQASKTFLLQAVHAKYPEMTATDIQLAEEGGAFTPFSTTFGDNSPHYKAAVKLGDRETLARFDRLKKIDDTISNIGTDRVRQIYGNDVAGNIMAGSNLFGVTKSEFSEWINRNGTVSLTGKGFDDTAKYVADDDGGNNRRADAGAKNQAQDVMDNLIQVETQAKDLIEQSAKSLDSIDATLKAAGFGGSAPSTAGVPGVAGAAEVPAPGGAGAQSSDSVVPRKSKGFWNTPITETLDNWKGEVETSRRWAHTDLNKGGLSARQKQVAQMIITESRRQRVDPALMLGLAMKESSLGENMTGAMMKSGMHKGDRAKGIFHYMAKSAKGWDRMDDAENIKHAVADFKANKEKFGNSNLAIAAHLTGAGRPEYKRGELPGAGLTDGMSDAQSYVNDVNHFADSFNKKLPAGASPATASKPLQANVNGTFVLQDYLGRQVANPVNISTTFSSPVPAGL